jgi:hypothetical protein
MRDVAACDGSTLAFTCWRIWLLALDSLPREMARLLTCCCWSPAAWLTEKLPW